MFQKLEGQVTREGLWLTSTAQPQTGEKLCVVACAVGRPSALVVLPPQAAVSVDDVQRDFVVAKRPEG